MKREQIEQTALKCAKDRWGDNESQHVMAKAQGTVYGFKQGAQWRINSVWHDGTASCEARRKALVLFKNGNAAVYKDLRDISFEQLWDEVDKFAYLADLLPDTRKEKAE